MANTAAQQLKALHVPACPIILPNVWDLASFNAVVSLNSQGSQPVKAIATASWAIAATLGIKDEDLSLDQNLEAISRIAPLCQAANLPLTVDLQDGYGDDIVDVVTRAVKCGAVGANIEDSIPSAGFGQGIAGSLYETEDQVRRLKLALKAARDAGCPDFVLNARCDIFKLDDVPGLDDETRMKEAIIRGKAYLDLGATSVFYWGGSGRGIRTAQVETLVRELDGKVAVKLSDAPESLTTAELAEIGVARISVGPSLFLIAQNAIKQAALTILSGGGLGGK